MKAHLDLDLPSGETCAFDHAEKQSGTCKLRQATETTALWCSLFRVFLETSAAADGSSYRCRDCLECLPVENLDSLDGFGWRAVTDDLDWRVLTGSGTVCNHCSGALEAALHEGVFCYRHSDDGCPECGIQRTASPKNKGDVAGEFDTAKSAEDF